MQQTVDSAQHAHASDAEISREASEASEGKSGRRWQPNGSPCVTFTRVEADVVTIMHETHIATFQCSMRSGTPRQRRSGRAVKALRIQTQTGKAGDRDDDTRRTTESEEWRDMRHEMGSHVARKMSGVVKGAVSE